MVAACGGGGAWRRSPASVNQEESLHPWAPFREGCRWWRTGADLLASEHTHRAFPADASGRAEGVLLGHSGGPAPVSHRTSLPPIRDVPSTVPPMRDRGAGVRTPAGVRCWHSRRGESGANPELTRSGEGDDRIAVPLGPRAREGDPGGRPRARTPGREHIRLASRRPCTPVCRRLLQRSTTHVQTLPPAARRHRRLPGRPGRTHRRRTPRPAPRSAPPSQAGADWIDGQQQNAGNWSGFGANTVPSAMAAAGPERRRRLAARPDQRAGLPADHADRAHLHRADRRVRRRQPRGNHRAERAAELRSRAEPRARRGQPEPGRPAGRLLQRRLLRRPAAARGPRRPLHQLRRVRCPGAETARGAALPG